MEIFSRTSIWKHALRQLEIIQGRQFYMWLNFVFNRKDESRVEEIGPDRVAAEWIVRNTGAIRFVGHERWITNYNALPQGTKGNYLLEAVNAKAATLTDNGLAHLVGLRHLKYFNMNSCKYISNLDPFQEVADCLEHLDAGNCGRISDISPLARLHKLKTLILTGTLGKNREEVIASLRKRLPDCEVIS